MLARRNAARLARLEGVQVPGVMNVSTCAPSCGNVWSGVLRAWSQPAGLLSASKVGASGGFNEGEGGERNLI